jgi:hypothetical protein
LQLLQVNFIRDFAVLQGFALNCVSNWQHSASEAEGKTLRKKEIRKTIDKRVSNKKNKRRAKIGAKALHVLSG